MSENRNMKDNYEMVDKTFSMMKANILGIFLVIPFLIFGPLVYNFVVGETSQSNGLIIALGFIIGILVHEFVHGFTWHLYCKNKWESIRFGIDKNTLNPYTTCSEILPIKAYRLGAFMPFIVTGVIPYILGIIINNATIVYIGVILMAISIGDLMILFTIIKEKSTSYCCDHPNLCGCLVYRKVD